MNGLAGVEGKAVVVTGGGGGLGRVLAAELCRLGARALVCGRTPATLEAAVSAVDAELGPGRAFSAVCDVRDPVSVDAMVVAAEDALGAIDGLVNNASGLFPVRAEKLSPNGFSAVVRTVLDGTFHCTSALARRWLASGQEGSVVNVLTPYAWTGGPGFAHTAAAKGGVLNLTRTLGVEWAARGVRVNAVAPGWMPVGGTDTLAADPVARSRLLASIPAQRFGRPEEVARAVAYLLSDDAAYITGACLTVDGGHHLSKGLLEFGDFGEEVPGR